MSGLETNRRVEGEVSMPINGPVVVMQLPEHLSQARQAKEFLEELQPLFEANRPRIVFDCSQVRQMGSQGVEMLLLCMEEAMKRDGDLKLAAVSPETEVMLELMRVDRLFEVFQTADEAIRSFNLPVTAAVAQERPLYATLFGMGALKQAS